MPLGRKISKFKDAALPLTGNESVDMLQNGSNVKTPLSNLFVLASGLGFEESADFASISASVAPRLIYVDVDENNFNDSSLYLYTGSELKFLQTVA